MPSIPTLYLLTLSHDLGVVTLILLLGLLVGYCVGALMSRDDDDEFF